MPKMTGRYPTRHDATYHVRVLAEHTMTLESEAERKGIPVSALIRMIVLEWLEARRGK